MYELAWHRTALKLLEALDAERLSGFGFLFGGGTRIVLELNEYRESHDIDFLCSDPAGYLELRRLVRSDHYRGLFTPNGIQALHFPREIRSDQYGVRFPTMIDDISIKVELIREDRVELSSGNSPPWSPVECLDQTDCYAIKLLANADRWLDRQVLSRDLLDLAAMRHHWGPIPEAAWKKAEGAYRAAARQDLEKAVADFQAHPNHQKRCLEGLGIRQPEPLLEAINALATDLRTAS